MLKNKLFKPVLTIIIIFIIVGVFIYFAQSKSIVEENKITESVEYESDGGAQVLGFEPMTCDEFEVKIKSAFPEIFFIKSTTDIVNIMPTNQGSTYCEFTASMTGVSWIDLQEDIKNYFEASSWIDNPYHSADGPSGTVFGYELPPTMATASISWVNDAELCPQNEPIVNCDAPLEKQITEVKIQLWK